MASTPVATVVPLKTGSGAATVRTAADRYKAAWEDARHAFSLTPLLRAAAAPDVDAFTELVLQPPCV